MYAYKKGLEQNKIMQKKPYRILVACKRDKRKECEDDRVNACANEKNKQRN